MFGSLALLPKYYIRTFVEQNIFSCYNRTYLASKFENFQLKLLIDCRFLRNLETYYMYWYYILALKNLKKIENTSSPVCYKICRTNHAIIFWLRFECAFYLYFKFLVFLFASTIYFCKKNFFRIMRSLWYRFWLSTSARFGASNSCFK